MKNKKILLMLFLLITLITLPVTCNAQDAPTMKWEELIGDDGDTNVHSNLYNINNDILAVHNTAYKDYSYIRLYNSSGEKKWEYRQGSVETQYFLINNEYVGIIDNLDFSKKNITLLNIKDGTVYKKIDITELVKNLSQYYYIQLLHVSYYNNKIVLLFHSFADDTYYLNTIDLDGNIELSKTSTFDNRFLHLQTIDIDNNIYGIETYPDAENKNIITFSKDTGEIISTTPTNNHIDINNLVKYKDGIMYCGSINGYMALEYYNLKTGTHQVKQFDEEGEIYSITTDDKDNLYIAGKYIDENTTGQAYFSKYKNNNWNFQKIYEGFYERDEYDEYFFTDILTLKNNKIILAGNTDDSGKYRKGFNFIVYYDGTKNYKIDKVIKGNGHLEVVESEEGDNEVKYQVKPGFGYKLISLKIVTESGKEIEVSDDYTFIMPNENITITAVFEPIISNPVTSNNIIKILSLLMISIPTIYLINKNIKKKKLNN